MEDLVQVKKKYLLFREDAKNLAEYIYRKSEENKSKVIFLDFSLVGFMSRSFIDEFLNVLDQLKTRGIEIKPLHLKIALKNFISHVKKAKSRIRDALTVVIK